MMARRYCTFVVDGLLCGIDADRVQEILRDQPFTPVPLAPPGVLGLINLRGQIVTAVDARCRLGMGDAPQGAARTHVIVRSGDEAVSLVVDAEKEILEVDPATFEDTPDTVPEAMSRMLAGVHKLDGYLLAILDSDRVVSVAAG
jgi:purine-binding chemotaxis protein CheW